jgi:hypothetical protein
MVIIDQSEGRYKTMKLCLPDLALCTKKELVFETYRWLRWAHREEKPNTYKKIVQTLNLEIVSSP